MRGVGPGRDLGGPPAFDLDLDEAAVRQPAIAQPGFLGGGRLVAVHVGDHDPVQAGQARRRDRLEREHVVRLGLVDLAQRRRRRDRLGQGVDPFEPVAPGDHRLPDPPQVVEGERAVLAAAVVVDPRPVAHRERAVADLATRRGQRAHLLDRVVVVALDLEPVALLALAPHEDPEVRQLLHRADREPAAPLEELAPLVGQRRPVVDGVVGHPAVEHQVVGAGDDDQRIELEVLHRPHRRAGALDPRQRRPGHSPLRPMT